MSITWLGGVSTTSSVRTPDAGIDDFKMLCPPRIGDRENAELLDRSLRLHSKNSRRYFGAGSVSGHLINGIEMFNDEWLSGVVGSRSRLTFLAAASPGGVTGTTVGILWAQDTAEKQGQKAKAQQSRSHNLLAVIPDSASLLYPNLGSLLSHISTPIHTPCTTPAPCPSHPARLPSKDANY